MKKVIFYLHGFNSASLDAKGNLLTTKAKLLVLQEFCLANDIAWYSPNVDYRDFQHIVDDLLGQWRIYNEQGFEVIFMGSSMGGFSSEYLAVKTGSKAIMINPAIQPSQLLPYFIGANHNVETGVDFEWQQVHCDQYLAFETAIAAHQAAVQRLVLLDLADELLDAEKTRSQYQDKAQVLTFPGGSHSFEHMREALPALAAFIFT